MLGISWLGMCSYNPSAPSAIYFSLGEAIGALAFTLAVQQLLKPVYRFRLFARHIRPSHLYMLVFAGALAHSFRRPCSKFFRFARGPWGYSIVWELIAAAFFAESYRPPLLFRWWFPSACGRNASKIFARGIAGIQRLPMKPITSIL